MSKIEKKEITETKYDLEERTTIFSEQIIRFAKLNNESIINSVLIKQLVRSGTSIGANYSEADCAETKKDFEHKIGICRKEAKETKYWLRLVIYSNPDLKQEATHLIKEANEFVLIFSSIIRKSKSRLV